MMDDLDRRLLECLRLDARESTAALARKLRLSRSTVQARLRRLEETGVIAGYTVRLAEDVSARLIRAHVMLSVSPKLAAGVVHALRKMEGVRALHTISGAYDMIAIAVAETMEAMDALIDRIGAVEGVERTTTSILMTTKFER